MGILTKLFPFKYEVVDLLDPLLDVPLVKPSGQAIGGIRARIHGQAAKGADLFTHGSPFAVVGDWNELHPRKFARLEVIDFLFVISEPVAEVEGVIIGHRPVIRTFRIGG